jgi:DNA ligase (NAD+)
MAVPKATQTRYTKLKETLNRHRHLYHVLDAPEISDEAYDKLEQELLSLEREYPSLIAPDSPSQRVGGEPLQGFKKVRHAVMQWSFNDAFDSKEMQEFDARVKRFLQAEGISKKPGYTCELKIESHPHV